MSSPVRPAQPCLLAIRGGALGDFVATFPALLAFKEKHGGQWPLHVITRPAYGPLAVSLGIADTWSALDAPEMLSLERADMDGSTLFQNVVHCLAWVPSTESVFARNLQATMPTTLRSSLVAGLPAWRFLLENDCPPPLPSPLANADGPVVIHAGSGSTRKNLQLETWQSVLAGLPPQWPAVLVVGEAEAESAVGHWAASQATAHLWRDLPLPELARRLRSARCFLGNDSGVGHLAAWLGVPCTILFGPSDSSVWKPYGPAVEVIAAADGTMESIQAETILTALAT